MSHALRQADAVARARSERLPRVAAAVATLLLHVLLVLLALMSRPVTTAPPQGSSGGGDSLQVTWIDETAPSPAPPSPAPPAAAPAPPRAAPARARVQPPPRAQGEEPVRPEAPPDAQAPALAEAPVERPARPAQRHARVYGQPPGMRMDDVARPRAGAGPGARSAVNRGRGNAINAPGISLEVDGYQVLYEPLGEARMREWREQGMTEVFLPLPGTRRYMVCPLEIVLRRGSGDCRMVDRDAPELATIGDARQILLMQRVYKLGDPLWSGPGPYR